MWGPPSNESAGGVTIIGSSTTREQWRGRGLTFLSRYNDGSCMDSKSKQDI